MLKVRSSFYQQGFCVLLFELELRWAPRVINFPLTLHDARSLRATNSEHLCFQLPSTVRN
jgi:hypothetical protein